MQKVLIFADGNVGKECVEFLIQEFAENISQIIVTNEESAVYKRLLRLQFEPSKIVFHRDLVNYQFNNIDYAFLIWWPFIVKGDVLSIPRIGTINTHPSLLPYNRGKHYNFWNIVEDMPFGVSLHFVDLGIDSGDIIFQEEIHKSWEDTGESLYLKALSAMTNLFKKSFRKIINGEYTCRKQRLDEGSYHHSKELEKASEIFLDQQYSAKELLNLLRARTFPPHPACYFFDHQEKFEVRISIQKIE